MISSLCFSCEWLQPLFVVCRHSAPVDLMIMVFNTSFHCEMSNIFVIVRYMAPELFPRPTNPPGAGPSASRSYTHKVDCYAFGITLWELASRRFAFSDIPDSGPGDSLATSP